MDKYWQVALTYLYRPRFLIAGGLYLLTSWWWSSKVAFDLRVSSSVEFACILACFIALHVRRQLGTSDRGVMPGYAVPHLAVAALVSTLVWVAVPWIQAELTGATAWQLIAPHAVAGLFLTLVAVWPKAIALLAASPVVIVWIVTLRFETRSTFLLRFIEGYEPAWSWALIVLTVAAHPLAAYVLLRQSEQGLAANDDFSIESVRPDRLIGRWESVMLASRDASVQRRMSAVGRRWWAIARWRIPVAVSWPQLALVTLCVTAMMALAEYAGRGNIVLAAMIVSAVMLIMPFGSWNARRHAIAMELMLPVTRPQLFRGLAGVLALDVCLWTALASAISATGIAIGIQRESKEAYFEIVIIYWVVLWGIAIWLYGISLMTLRFRYWIPLIVTSGVGWVLGTVVLVNWYESRFRKAYDLDPFAWSFLTAVVGLLLAWFAYRRSLEADLA